MTLSLFVVFIIWPPYGAVEKNRASRGFEPKHHDHHKDLMQTESGTRTGKTEPRHPKSRGKRAVYHDVCVCREDRGIRDKTRNSIRNHQYPSSHCK